MKPSLVICTLIFSLLLASCTKTEDMPKHIDHLVYTAPSLEEGIKEIESLLGVKPVMGGRHPNYGTHNALLSLGETTYLEIVAPDPAQPEPEKGRFLGESYDQEPKLTTWVMREEQIEEVQANALTNGLDLGEIDPGKREKPDGTILSWKVTDPYAFLYHGAIPFLISWGDTAHPAKNLPVAGELVGFEIEHPEAEMVRESLKLLNVNVKVSKGPEAKIIAKIKTENGIVRLQ